MHALRILRSHGLPTESLQMIFKAVVVAKLLGGASHLPTVETEWMVY